MASIDVEKFLEPISDEAPCGEDLEYDAAFGELERSAHGKPEQRMGDEVIAAEPPNWSEVFSQAQELLGRSRDLRIVVHLTHAGLHTEGFPALADGLRLIHGLVENYWDSVFPMLDVEDNNDPSIRVNSLLALQDIKDPQGFIRSLMRTPLVDSKKAGKFSLRDIRIANGELHAGPDEETPDGGLIDAAFLDCDLDALQATSEAANTAATELAALDTYLREQVGVQLAPDFTALKDEVSATQKVLAAHLAERGVATDAGEAAAGEAPRPAEGGLGQIASREDAIRVIDRLSEYFRRNEPSSPVPLLLKRAKRLVAKDFMEILEDLAPEGLAQAKLLSGKEPEE